MIPDSNLHWRKNVEGWWDFASLGTGSNIWVKLKPGDYTIKLDAIDSLGLLAEDSLVLHVRAAGTGIPTARILSPESDSGL